MLAKIVTAILTLALFVSGPMSFAASNKGTKANESSIQGPRRHMGTIIFAGLAGAILGLSTLSFYGRPQDRLSNIAVGCAIGIISGTFYTTYKAAPEPKDFYSSRDAEAE